MKKILNFPTLRQIYNYDCGANALQGVLDYYGINIREEFIIKKAKTNKSGTMIKNLKKATKYFNLKYQDGTMTIENLKKYIDKKIPVIIAIQAWTDKKNNNWQKDWKDGHYVVVIGYSKNKIYFEDPSFERRTFLSYKELEKRWHDIDICRRKVINWGMAIYRPAHSRKLHKWFCTDFWRRGYKPGFYYNKEIHMD